MDAGRRTGEAPVVSVCIAVVSDHGLIEGCLRSIWDSHPSVPVEVVVVANGLRGTSLAQLQARSDIVLVESSVNAGFSGGNNLAAGAAKGDYLLLLNDDSVVTDGFVDRLLSAVDRDPSIAAAGGKIVSTDGTLQEAGSVLWSDGWVAHVGSGLPADGSGYDYVRDVDYISANGLLVDRRAWDAVGGLDERYFPAYYEDVDLCLALRALGHRVVYEPRATLEHLESQSTSSPFRSFLLVRNRALLVEKWSTSLQELPAHPEPVDAAAIDAAVLRSQHSIGRVLVVEGARGSDLQMDAAVEALATAGWSVIVTGPRSMSGGEVDAAARDRLIGLGVEMRGGGPEHVLSRSSSHIDAAVVPDVAVGAALPLRRADGSLIPFVALDEDPGSIVARLGALAPARSAVSQGASGSGSGSAVPGQRHLRRAEESERPHAAGPKGIHAGSGQRDSAFLEAEATIRDEYLGYLERELARLEEVMNETDVAFDTLVASYDDKERYIAGLPSVRAKKWITSLLKRGS